jgi:hypothetical protein
MADKIFVYLTSDGVRHEVPIIPHLVLPVGARFRRDYSRPYARNRDIPSPKVSAGKPVQQDVPLEMALREKR